MASDGHNHNPNFPSTLRAVYEKCQQVARLETPKSSTLLRQDAIKFVCVWTGLESTLDLRTFRRTLGQTVLGQDTFRLVEVVGDSSHGFTPLGRQTAKDVIISLLADSTEPVVLEYGYSASRHDANWIVNDILTQTPELRSRTVANVVYRSLTAVEKWGCEATAHVGNMVLVYDEHTQTEFGSDTWISDDIMSPLDGDILVCLEGGPQTFAQAVGVCLKRTEVVVLTGPGMREGDTTEPNFSAGHLLKILNEEFTKCVDRRNVTIADKARMQHAATVYLESIKALQGETGRTKYEAIQSSVSMLVAGAETLQKVRIRHVM